MLNRLKVCTSPGDDRIHNILLKRLPASYVSKILVKLINLSVKTELPVSWKEAIITMIPKKDHKSSDPSDYRPISLTSCVGKLAERLIKSRLYPFLEKNKIIVDSQSGFREKEALEIVYYFLPKKSRNGLSKVGRVVVFSLIFLKPLIRYGMMA